MVLGKLPCSALLRSRPMLLVPHLFHHSALAVAGKDIACPFQLRTQYHVLNLLLINTCWAGPVKASHNLSMCFGMALRGQCAGKLRVLTSQISSPRAGLGHWGHARLMSGAVAVPLHTRERGCSCLFSSEVMLYPLQIFEPQLSHCQLGSRCHRPLEALWGTHLPKEDGDGPWSSEPSSPLGFPMPSPSPSPCSSKRLRSSSMRPAAKSPGSPPSCWLLCTQEVSGLAAVYVLGSDDLHLL